MVNDEDFIVRFGNCRGPRNHFHRSRSRQTKGRSRFVNQIFNRIFAFLRNRIKMIRNLARCNETPILTSLCRASKPRFYYKADTNECKDFIYGGCGANGNIFVFREDCEKLCKK